MIFLYFNYLPRTGFIHNATPLRNIFLSRSSLYLNPLKSYETLKFGVSRDPADHVISAKKLMSVFSLLNLVFVQNRICVVWNEKGYSTGYSQAVTHPSTNPACGCLTSEIERDRVHSTEYGRIHWLRNLSWLYISSVVLLIKMIQQVCRWFCGRAVTFLLCILSPDA